MSEEKTEPVIASTGKVERVQLNIPQQENTDNQDNGQAAQNQDQNTDTNELTPEKKAENIAAGLNEDGTTKKNGLDK